MKNQFPDSPVGFTPNPDGPFPAPDIPMIQGRFERLPQITRDDLRAIRYGPATIKILIVVDGSIRFDTAGFGLGRVINTLTDTTHPDFPSYARFEITKATRAEQNGRTDADDYTFVFTSGSLDNYDELWLFGIDDEDNFISDPEAQVVADFMDAGGGVLAMGDHEDLGLGLCGKLPRVRSMRKWWFDPVPAGELKAPDGTDLTRIDTVQPITPGGDPNAGSQGDEVPQPIWPQYKLRFFGGRIVSFPHPVLCGPRGVIDIFPDHAHEGDCVVPTDLSKPLVEGSALPEYPGGIAPEVIAQGRTVAGRTKGIFTLPNSDPFGLLGAYNGHHNDANVGRVLVDSTWHHWFNVNLNDFATSVDPTVKTHWDDIQAYFRNCAIWLAPKGKQSAMRRAGQLISFQVYPLVEFLNPAIRRFDFETIYHLGIYATDALGRLASRCQSTVWILEPFIPINPDFFSEFRFEERISKMSMMDAAMSQQAYDAMTMAAYGGAVRALWMALKEKKKQDPSDLLDEMDEIMISGAKEGLKLAQKELRKASKQLEKMLK